MTSDAHPGAPSLKVRVHNELRNYAIVAAYLYVCFASVLLYKSALLREVGLGFLPHGIAAVKALLFFVLLVVLSVMEELLVGKVHGHSFAQTLAEYEKHSVLEMIATCLLLLVVLVPLITAKAFSRALGPGVLTRALSGSDPCKAE
jgi:hypothetical protein